MANQLSAGSGVLLNAANIVAAHRAQQQAIINKVEATVQALSPSWTGAGGRAFTLAATRWVQDANSNVRALNLFEQSLRGTDATYQQSEEEAAANANQLQGSSEGYHGVMI